MGKSFQHEGHYKCICGREFTKSQSYNAHLSHCRLHLGDDKYEKQHVNRQLKGLVALNARIKQTAINNRKIKQLEWDSREHYCKTAVKNFLRKLVKENFVHALVLILDIIQ